jgi:hypothetical protein
MTGWDFVGTVKVEKAERGCKKVTVALGASITVQKKLMTIVSKTPVVGKRLEKMVEALPDASAQVFASGSGKICCNCWDICKFSLNLGLTLGNGSHGGNQKTGLDWGVWALGTGEWNMCEGALYVGGSLNWAVNINYKWVAYNADGQIWNGNLIGPTGATNTLLDIGGPFESLKVAKPCTT